MHREQNKVSKERKKEVIKTRTAVVDVDVAGLVGVNSKGVSSAEMLLLLLLRLLEDNGTRAWPRRGEDVCAAEGEEEEEDEGPAMRRNIFT